MSAIIKQRAAPNKNKNKTETSQLVNRNDKSRRELEFRKEKKEQTEIERDIRHGGINKHTERNMKCMEKKINSSRISR